MNKAQNEIRKALATKSAASVDSEQVMHDLEARFVALKEEHRATQQLLDEAQESNGKLRKDASSQDQALRDMQVSVVHRTSYSMIEPRRELLSGAGHGLLQRDGEF